MFNFSSLEAMNSENEQISNKEANQRMADYSMNGMKDRFVLYNSECSSDMDVKIIKNDSQSDKCALDVEEISSMEVVIPSFLFNDEAYSKMFGLTSTKTPIQQYADSNSRRITDTKRNRAAENSHTVRSVNSKTESIQRHAGSKIILAPGAAWLMGEQL